MIEVSVGDVTVSSESESATKEAALSIAKTFSECWLEGMDQNEPVYVTIFDYGGEAAEYMVKPMTRN